MTICIGWIDEAYLIADSVLKILRHAAIVPFEAAVLLCSVFTRTETQGWFISILTIYRGNGATQFVARVNVSRKYLERPNSVVAGWMRCNVRCRIRNLPR
jgi:hypothetical protein